jgi:DNA-binding NarL/FixJ family response regulator
MENNKKGKKAFSSRYSNFENTNEPLDLEKYEELVEEGYSDSDIANELNISEEFLQNLKKDIEME